jgi:hypothetical protein
MVRIVALTVALTLLSASAGFAQSFGDTPGRGRPVPSQKLDLSAKAAGLEKTTPATASSIVIPAAPLPRAPQTKRSVWKSPWPYAIIGAALVAGLYFAYRDTDPAGDGY